MSGWLAAAKADAPVASAPRVPEAKAGTTKVVVDANAIVKGIRLERLAEEAVTIPEVLREIKDKQARHTLATLPFELKVRDPDEASIKAVRRFARLTGDLGALSDPDVRCIALHLMLENEAHGLAHVRSEPPPLVLSKHKHNKQTKQPGWDYVPDEDAWAELDAMNAEAERSAAEVAGRMASASLAEAPEKPPPLPATALLALEMKERLEKKRQKQRETEALLGEEGLGSALSVTNGETDEKNVVDDDGGWEQNVSRTTRVRRAKRAERQREAGQALAEQAEGEEMVIGKAKATLMALAGTQDAVLLPTVLAGWREATRELKQSRVVEEMVSTAVSTMKVSTAVNEQQPQQQASDEDQETEEATTVSSPVDSEKASIIKVRRDIGEPRGVRVAEPQEGIAPSQESEALPNLSRGRRFCTALPGLLLLDNPLSFQRRRHVLVLLFLALTQCFRQVVGFQDPFFDLR